MDDRKTKPSSPPQISDGSLTTRGSEAKVVRHRETLEEMLDGNVWHYIRKHKLYAE